MESEWDKRSSQTERANFHPYTAPHRTARTRVTADRVAENDLARSRKRRCSDENKRADVSNEPLISLARRELPR